MALGIQMSSDQRFQALSEVLDQDTLIETCNGVEFCKNRLQVLQIYYLVKDFF